MIDPSKVAKLIPRLQLLASGMDGLHDRHIHQQVSQFYYMQKAEELKLLLEQLEETQRKLEKITSRTEATYSEVFCQWRTDMRWLRAQIGKW